MRATKKDNNSALKRLIPAVAMLALSAVTLSTSTYAWFTMSKTVEVTGLNMAATASGGIEVALASVKGNDKVISFSYTNGHPDDTDDELGWGSSVIVGNYYKDIGKLNPASSADGVNIFYATDASNGGKVASEFANVSDTNNGGKAVVDPRDKIPSPDGKIESTGTSGYYVDIPVHIRTSKTAPGAETKADILYKMVINNNEESGSAKASNALYKAVRVAFIESNAASIILGADNNYYTNSNGHGAVKSVDSTTKKGTKEVPTKLTTDGVFNTYDLANESTAQWNKSGMQIDYANGDNYGHLDFTIRVWLEGESESCYDSNSGQQWNIGFIFSLPDENSGNGGQSGQGG